MSLIVEDGTGVAGAESYNAVSDADAYWAKRTSAAIWAAGSLAQKEGALREATQYLDYSYNWLGGRSHFAQPLYWPRFVWAGKDNQTLPINTIPQVIKDAQCELALICVTGTRLIPVQKRGGLIKSQTVGSLSVVYMDNAPGVTRYDWVDMLVQDYSDGLRFGGISGRAVRG